MMGAIRLRPHHLLCIHGFRGQGYSPLFVANMARLVDRLKAHPETKIKLVAGTDDICSACPHISAGMCGRPDQTVDDLDRRVMARLDMDKDHAMTWSAIQATIRERIAPVDLGQVCSDCRWLDLDYCTNGLSKLSGRDIAGD